MIDWQRVCFGLRRQYGSLRCVSRKIGYRNPDYLARLERGEVSDPRFSVGLSLIDIYVEHFGRDIPMVSD